MKVLSCAALAICAFAAIPSDAQQGSESGVNFLGFTRLRSLTAAVRPAADLTCFRSQTRVARLSPTTIRYSITRGFRTIVRWKACQDSCGRVTRSSCVRAKGIRLIIHYERGSTIRSIVMNGAAAPGDHPNSHLGYSVGRWEGDVLTIDTTHMLGFHLSGGARATEPGSSSDGTLLAGTGLHGSSTRTGD